MTAGNHQVVQLYETEGMTPEQIAEVMGIEVEVVKTLLLQTSMSFRAAVQKDNSLVSEELLQDMFHAYIGLARGAESDAVREKATRHIINLGMKVNKGLGSTDAIVQTARQGGGNINIYMLNQQLQKARSVLAQVKQKQLATAAVQPIIDIPCPVKQLEDDLVCI